MSSYRFTAAQIEWLKSKKCPATDIIKAAVMRYRSGEFVIRKPRGRKPSESVLRVVPVRNRFSGIDDELMRQILDAHRKTPNIRLEKRLESAEKAVRLLTAQTIRERHAALARASGGR